MLLSEELTKKKKEGKGKGEKEGMAEYMIVPGSMVEEG
jgi:hypothetical protein